MAIAVTLTAAIAIASIVAVTWLPAIFIKSHQVRELRKRCSEKLALTYDDGPGPLMTPALLDVLRRHNAKATFFLVGFRALRFPDMCRMLAAGGHQLGCHTHMHKKPWRVLPWQTATDVAEGYRTMSQWVAPNASFRPPFGKLTTWSWLATRHRHAPLCWWTCDGCDTHPNLPDPRAVAEEVIRQGGGVVLLHGHDRGADRQAYVLELTERLLVAAKQKGIEVCTMAQLHEPAMQIAGEYS